MNNKDDYETLNEEPQNNLKTNGYNPNLKQELDHHQNKEEELPKKNIPIKQQLPDSEIPEPMNSKKPKEKEKDLADSQSEPEENSNQLKNDTPYNQDLTNPLSKENNKEYQDSKEEKPADISKKNAQPNKMDNQQKQQKPKTNGFKNNRITNLINKRAQNKKTDNQKPKDNNKTDKSTKGSEAQNKLANKAGKAADLLSQANQIKEQGAPAAAKNFAKQKVKQQIKLAIIQALPTILPIVGIALGIGFVMMLLFAVIIAVFTDDDNSVSSINVVYCTSVNVTSSSGSVKTISDDEYIAYELSTSIVQNIDNESVIEALAVIYRTNLYSDVGNIADNTCSVSIQSDYVEPTDSKYLELVQVTGKEVYTFDISKLSILPVTDYFSWKERKEIETGEYIYTTYLDDYNYPASWVENNVPSEYINNDSSVQYGYSPYMALFMATNLKENYHDLLFHFYNYNPNDPSELAFQKGTLFKVDTGETEDGTASDSSGSNYGYSSDCDGISLTTTSLTREEFISSTEAHAQTDSFIQPLANIAGDIYDLCIQQHFNPELVIIRAAIEQSPGQSYHNYWGIGCANGGGLTVCSKYSSDIIGVQSYISIMQGYSASSLYEVYNTNHYAYVGHQWKWYGDSHYWSDGGCIYYPYIKKYLSSTRSTEISTACDTGNVIETNDEDQSAYSYYNIQESVDYRKSIFGITADTCSSGTLSGSDLYQLGQQVANKAVATFDSYSYSKDKRGQVGYVDCSSMIDRTYQMFNIYYFYQNGWYGTTYTEKSWCESNGVLFSNTSTDNLMPGDLLFYHNYKHVEMYIGNGQKFGAHTDDYVQSAQVSVTTYQSGSSIAGCRPLSVYLREKS